MLDIHQQLNEYSEPKAFKKSLRKFRLKVTPFITGFLIKAVTKLTDCLILLFLLKIYTLIFAHFN